MCCSYPFFIYPFTHPTFLLLLLRSIHLPQPSPQSCFLSDLRNDDNKKARVVLTLVDLITFVSPLKSTEHNKEMTKLKETVSIFGHGAPANQEGENQTPLVSIFYIPKRFTGKPHPKTSLKNFSQIKEPTVVVCLLRIGVWLLLFKVFLSLSQSNLVL